MKLTKFQQLSVASRLSLAMIIPLCGVLALMLFNIGLKWRTVSDLEYLSHLYQLTPIVGSIAHNLQKERGLSATFSASNGKTFSDQLAAQRKKTDQQLTHFSQQLSTIDLSSLDTEFRTKIESMDQFGDQISPIRLKVDTLVDDSRQILREYSELIAQYHKVVRNISVLSSNSKMTSTILAYDFLIQGKDLLGQQRALGAVILERSGLTFSDTPHQFHTLKSQRQLLLDQVSNYNQTDISEEIQLLSSKIVWQQFVKTESRLLDIIYNKSADQLDTNLWFQHASLAMNQLADYETSLVTSIYKLSIEEQSRIRKEFYLLAVISIFFLATCLCLVQLTIRSVSRPLGRMNKAILSLAAGNNDVFVPELYRKDEIGGIARALAVFKQLKIQLDNAHSRIQLAADAAGIGIWVWDLKSDSLSWDSWMYRLYGISPDQFTNTYEAWENGVHPEDRERAAKEAQQAKNQGHNFDSEFRVVWPNGEVRHIKAVAQITHDSEGSAISMIGINLDITDMKRVQTQLLRAKEDADIANRAKSTFLSNMSHEIRTPMNAILGYVQLLKRAENISQEQQQFLQNISSSGEHLLGIINDILDMSKIEGGKLTTSEQNFDLQLMLEDLRNKYISKMNGQLYQLKINDLRDIPRFLYGDEEKIKRILENLLSNAMKFTQKGSIDLSLALVKKKGSHCSIQFVVEDTGKGITPETLKSIFDPFEQHDHTRVTDGTGLGLAISKELAEEMNGNLSVTSTVGKGSRFVFTVPLNQAEASPAARIEEKGTIYGIDSCSHCPLTLIVDDSETNRDVLRRLLAPMGFELLFAKDGLQAIEMVKKHSPEVILMDVVMPNLNGLEATRGIRHLPQGKDTTIIAITASALDQEIEEIKELGANSVIQKPVVFQQLFRELESKAGVQFSYEKNKTELKHTFEGMDYSTANLPDELKVKLISFLELGDISRIKSELEEVELFDQRLASFLKELIDSYDLNRMHQLLSIKEKATG